MTGPSRSLSSWAKTSGTGAAGTIPASQLATEVGVYARGTLYRWHSSLTRLARPAWLQPASDSTAAKRSFGCRSTVILRRCPTSGPRRVTGATPTVDAHGAVGPPCDLLPDHPSAQGPGMAPGRMPGGRTPGRQTVVPLAEPARSGAHQRSRPDVR